MRAGVAKLLVRLYPRYWRDRYGEEFEALLQTRAGNLRTSANVIWSALRERVSPTPGLNQGRRSVQLHSWCMRAPWAVFGLGPLLFLAVAYFVACFILWSGWRMFLPQSNTPFIPVGGYAVFYFEAGKLLYYAAPILVGWAVVLVCARQNPKAVWPGVGLVLIALVGGTTQVHAYRAAGGPEHVSLGFALGSFLHGIPGGASHALMILSLTMLPFVVWRFQKDLASR